MEKTEKFQVYFKIPDFSGIDIDGLLLIESQRQNNLDLATKYLRNSYLKCKVEPIITGDSYQSRGLLLCTPTMTFSILEACRVLKALGATVNTVPKSSETYHSLIAAYYDKNLKSDKSK